MSNIPSLFERFMFEAPGDDPPDTTESPTEETNPPDMPETSVDDNGPPDIPDEPADTGGDDGSAPPDMDGGDDAFSNDDGGFDDTGNNPENGDDQNEKELGLDDKVSAIMNMNLYQRYLTLLSKISSQLAMVKNNIDILYTLSPSSIDIVESLNKLDENIRLYLKNYFLNENYSKNLLFFNKCLNLLKLLNDSFDGRIRKGIKDTK